MYVSVGGYRRAYVWEREREGDKDILRERERGER
jgi:hypothetical protein